MGTSCVVRFVDEGRSLCAFYKHYDGGAFKQELYEFLEGYEIVCGLPLGVPTGKKIANGIGDLAAQAIAYFKDGPGDIYMCHPENEGDFTYEIDASEGEIAVRTI